MDTKTHTVSSSVDVVCTFLWRWWSPTLKRKPSRDCSPVRLIVHTKSMSQVRLFNRSDIQISQYHPDHGVQSKDGRLHPQSFSTDDEPQSQPYRVLHVSIRANDDHTKRGNKRQQCPISPVNQIICTGECQPHPSEKKQTTTVGRYHAESRAGLFLQPQQLPRENHQQQAKSEDRGYGSSEGCEHGYSPRKAGFRFSNMACTPSFASALLRARFTNSWISWCWIVSRRESVRRIVCFIPASESGALSAIVCASVMAVLSSSLGVTS